MLDINKIEKTNTYEFELTGTIDATSANNLYRLIDQKAKDKDAINLMGIIKAAPKYTSMDAFTDSIKARKKASKSVNKYAVVSDIDWIKSAFPLAEILNTDIPIKYFHLDEKDKALDWLEKKEVPEYTPEEFLTNIDIEPIEGTNIYSFTVNDTIDEAGIQALYKLIKEKAEDGKIRLLAKINQFPKVESFQTFINGLRLDIESLGVVDKYAVVSDKKVVQAYTKIGDFFTPSIPIKVFDQENESKAIQWLKEN